MTDRSDFTEHFVCGDAHVFVCNEYVPFGVVIRVTGPIAKLNPFRFSTKYQDDESDLLYYGYRYYTAIEGRWLSLDPLGEVGFELVSEVKPVSTRKIGKLRNVLNTLWYRDAFLAASLESTFLQMGLDVRKPKIDPSLSPISLSGRLPENDASINPYVYVANNALNAVDPIGLWIFYGNWCGPDWTGGREEEYNPADDGDYKAPIDALDTACQTHDKCYYNCRSKFPCSPKDRSSCFRNCDMALVASARAIGGFWADLLAKGIDRPGTRDPGPNSAWCCNSPGKEPRPPLPPAYNPIFH